MNTNSKIRWLLLLVTICLFATALTARWSATNLVNLFSLAENAQELLHQKETFVYDYLSEPENVENLQKLENNANEALNTINLFTSKNIFFQTYKKEQLVFWSDAFVSFDKLSDLKEGSTFVNQGNSYFEIVKRSYGDFTIAFFIPIYYSKSEVVSANQLAKEAIINTPLLDIASLLDSRVADISNIEGKYLFSVKMNLDAAPTTNSNLEILMWVIGFITLIICVNSYLRHLAFKGYPITATLMLITFFVALRGLSLYFKFPFPIYNLEVFNPKIYYLSVLFPSIADTFLHVFVVLWVIVFMNSYKEKAIKAIQNYWISYLILAVSMLTFLLVSNSFIDIFKSLVFNSNINFNVSNLVNLNWLSVLGIAIIMMGSLAYYLLLEFLFYLTFETKISVNQKIIILGISYALYLLYLIFTAGFTIYPLLVLVIVVIVAQTIYYKKAKLTFPSLVIITFLLASICSLKLSGYRKTKELEVRKSLIKELVKQSESDIITNLVRADSLINKDIYTTKALIEAVTGEADLQAYLDQKYFKNFKIKYALYDIRDSLVKSNYTDVRSLNYYQNFITENGFKLTQLFYKTSDNFNQENYHAVIKLNHKEQVVGSLYIYLNSLQSNNVVDNLPYTQLNKSDEEIFTDYSYAIYRNKKLFRQNGPFLYKIVNKDFIVKDSELRNIRQDDFEHLVFRPNFNNTIVISHQTPTFWRELAALSFFFVIFLITAIIVYSYRWVFSSIYISNISLRNIQKRLLAFNNKILYKTRIQIALVLAVVSSLFIIGIITFSYISIQYKDQQNEFLGNRIKIITESFQENLAGANRAKNLDNSSLSFQDFSKLYGADINLFNLQGKLISTTKSNLFEDGLLAPRMNPIAFIKLNIDKNSEFIHEEELGSLDYTSAYMPIKSVDNNVLGYLQVPYFSNLEDYNQKIGSFLNLLINIYVLVFVAVGFFAFVVANQITGPLSIIQESISTTMIGRKNKPIEWKRSDEIGTLIIEYNNMIAKLEDNANKLAQSERETAWREMAKQVAHEIKNPLTPLRLGIQMLDRSWREKDPKFDDKFLKFSKSFIEQIDSLSRIASEFSNFAKMPQLKLEHIDVIEVLNKAVDVYSQMDNIQINHEQEPTGNFIINADKDQLLRSFNNILKNAIEAIPQNKQGVININCTIINHNVQIVVSDNGSGIPLNLRENIFVPNFTTKSSGTGLGLAFVKQAIENMKGNIYFTTEIDVGTMFYISLPLV